MDVISECLPDKNADYGRPNRHVGTPKSYSRGLDSCEDASESGDRRETPTTQGRPRDETALQITSSLPSAMPPKGIVAEGIALYFQYCHKQPLWLFDPEDLPIPENCRCEVIFGILSLALRYSNNPVLRGRIDQMCRQYAETACSYAMLRLTEGTVNISTIQSFCLFALAEYISENTY